MSKFKQTNTQIQSSIRFSVLAAALFFVGMIFASGITVQAGEHHELENREFNERGNIVIADQFNNRVIEIDPETHKVIWQFGNGEDKPGPNSVVGTNDAERVGELTLISGTGIPGGVTPPLPGCSDPVNGCADNRVILVNEKGRIVWQYGQDGVAGAGPDQLNVPVAATFLPNGHVLNRPKQ